MSDWAAYVDELKAMSDERLQTEAKSMAKAMRVFTGGLLQRATYKNTWVRIELSRRNNGKSI